MTPKTCIELFTIGPYTINSIFRPGDDEGYHNIQNGAVDFTPSWFWPNVFLFNLIWSGGMGFDPNPTNRHIHLDIGPFRRWIE